MIRQWLNFQQVSLLEEIQNVLLEITTLENELTKNQVVHERLSSHSIVPLAGRMILEHEQEKLMEKLDKLTKLVSWKRKQYHFLAWIVRWLP